MTGIAGLGPEDISRTLLQEKPFRGRQIFQWIHRGAADFSGMTDLPKTLRETLQSTIQLYETSIADTLTDQDGTAKLTLKLFDSRFIECVLLTDREGRKTACLSSQAGCAMGCAFCKTGQMGFFRNLHSREIVEQFLHINRLHGPVSHIVFMGMGEPLANLIELREAVRVLNHPEGSCIRFRRITVSTCGLPEQIRELAVSGPPVRLAVSLVSADDELRNRIMQINKKYPLASLREALQFYQEQNGKRITLEYVLLPNVNDRPKDIGKLSAFTKGLSAVVNLIPWNPVPGMPYAVPTMKQISTFSDRLGEAGIHVTRRRRRGRGIDGACGQLAVNREED